MAARVEAAVAERVAAALQSPEVQARLEARLREERAKLEEKVGWEGVVWCGVVWWWWGDDGRMNILAW
jgi:hypothetical protein